MNQQPSIPDPGVQFQRGVSIFVFVCRALALSAEVFLRRPSTFGERYIGLQAGLAMLLIFFFPICCEGQDPWPLFFFLACFLFMCVCIRARIQLRRTRGGPQPHTMYTGTPCIMRFTGRMREERVKAIVEPMLVFLAGVLLLGACPVLGRYLVLVSLGLLVTANLTMGYEHKRALDMHDAFIDQRNAAERFRSLRRD